MRRVLGLALGISAPLAAQQVSRDSLRVNLYRIAADSMMGRATGSEGNYRTAEWVASAFRRYGLEPRGVAGGWFQEVPFRRIRPDTTTGLTVAGRRLEVGPDIIPVRVPMTWVADSVGTIFGGTADDTTSFPPSGAARGKLVVLRPPQDVRTSVAQLALLRRHPRFIGAAGFAVASLDAYPPGVREVLLSGQPTQDTMVPTIDVGLMLVSRAAAAVLLGTSLETAAPGRSGPAASGRVGFVIGPLAFPARNVIGVLPGSDPARAGTYVSITAHNDHVGTTRPPLDHDSIRAFNRVMRPLGADTRPREPTDSEAARIRALRDSLRAAHRPRLDSIFNGADDDGSGTVALVELARVLSRGPRPARSILFISHTAEERGLLGARWFTDHPTLPLDSIVAEIDVDMIGRGGAQDLPNAGPGYLEIVGSKRLSTEFGAILDTVAAHSAEPFHFNYEYDAPGHPLQYYCRADHFAYARYGIPSVSLSTGEHLDYHQVTDEPQYIDYHQLAQVTTLVREVALVVANLDHRPAVDGPRGDPHAPCRQ